VPASWIPDEETIGRYESSDNPNAINMTDSNAAAGDPSRGIMQLIGTTFAQYHVPGTSMNIFDPIANIAAGSRYIGARYGNPGNVPGIISLGQGGKYVGYDSGGVLPPGMTVAVNQTGRPEAILTPEESAAFQQIVKQLTANGGAPAGGKPSVTFMFNGTQLPTAEQQAEMDRHYSLLVG
jgi:SLT domain-containing protein